MTLALNLAVMNLAVLNLASPEALGALVVVLAGWACRETLFQLWERIKRRRR